MFIVTEFKSNAGFILSQDTKDVGDIVIGITGSEDEGIKITNICGHMLFGDKFISKKYLVECVKD